MVPSQNSTWYTMGDRCIYDSCLLVGAQVCQAPIALWRIRKVINRRVVSLLHSCRWTLCCRTLSVVESQKVILRICLERPCSLLTSYKSLTIDALNSYISHKTVPQPGTLQSVIHYVNSGNTCCVPYNCEPDQTALLVQLSIRCVTLSPRSYRD